MPGRDQSEVHGRPGEADEVLQAIGIRHRTFIRHCVLTPVVCVWTLYGALYLSNADGVFASVGFRALSLASFIGFSFLLIKSVVNFFQLLMHYFMCKDFGFLTQRQKNEMAAALYAALYANAISIANVLQIVYADKAWALLGLETIVWLSVELRFRLKTFPAEVATGSVEGA